TGDAATKTSTCPAGDHQAYASATYGTTRLRVTRFLVSDVEVISEVVGWSEADLVDLWRVTHDFHPHATRPDIYQIDVKVENLLPSPQPTLYGRVMDWDIYPTPFSEY